MKIRRVPIALRLFLTVLLTTLVITTVSLSVLHWTMQKNFARYVADVEMQKLDHLIENLADVYGVYQDWGNAVQAQILQIEGDAAPDDYDKLSRWWLRRQYDIALQQRYFKEHTMMATLGQTEGATPKSQLDKEEIKILEENLPSAYQPFEGLKFPLSSNQNLFKPSDRKAKPPMDKGHIAGGQENPPAEGKESSMRDPMRMVSPKNGKKMFVSMPDRLGLSSRLSLYDAKHQFVLGEPSDDQVSYRPIIVNERVVGYLGLKPVLDEDDASSINFFSSQKRYLVLIYIFTFLSSLVAALLLATYFKTPIQRLLNGTRELTKGNFQHQVAIKRNDELGDLSTELNQLAVILDQHETSRRQWVADTSHELKTPLAVLQAQIEAMQDGIRKPTPEHFAAMLRQVTSLKKLTQDLADLAQAEAQQLKCYFAEVDPWSVVLQEIDNFKPKFEQANLNVSATGEGAKLQLDIDRFKQIMVNLLGNSIRYTEAGGEVQVHTEQDADSWSVIVDDSPLGLSDEQIARLGERFYRVDDSRTRSTGGTGLGLALSGKIAQALGGQLSFDHSPLGGLRCKLTFSKHTKV
ncbi:sensor histidine kinase efflux regulator BaeS [Acinetobacter bereziniae]|uniref:sensor histidine kinase efflux regulator BaeS n=1 Tax=Acinetobacter bereziniae TaxID=106648 RepID=UPI0021D139EA|nr:sensor histidine kinase efflux regulator BaeS [Acinetobacter bereziniae]MCU4436956.1 sensor histidine kinase efflux regulator BaeS [Acinetobacter bereziniae]